MGQHTTIFDENFKISESDLEFNYQRNLTASLDLDGDNFDQNKLNEIILWKVNRYANFSDELISLINSIGKDDTEMDIDKTKLILKKLLRTKGVQLAMASTILRFRNKNIYQIIDQRVYRIINKNRSLKLNNYLSEKNLDNQIQLYIQYLAKLKEACENLKIPFYKSDRNLWQIRE